MRNFALITALLAQAASAAAVAPFVLGGLADTAPGSWTFVRKSGQTLVPAGYGYTFYLGGGVTYDLAKFRQKRIIPTLSLDTDAGFTRIHREWRTKELEGWEQTFYQITATETFTLRVKVPAGDRLITPYVGVGGGFAIIPTSIDRLEGFRGSGQAGMFEDSVSALKPVYTVPFGVEITLTPSSTIFWRFGPVAPVGKAVYEYQTGPTSRERVESSVPNSFLVVFGYRWGQ